MDMEFLLRFMLLIIRIKTGKEPAVLLCKNIMIQKTWILPLKKHFTVLGILQSFQKMKKTIILKQENKKATLLYL